MHARIFRSLGAEVRAVLGSSDESAANAAADLGGGVMAFTDLEQLLAEPLDAVSICTPPAVHRRQLLAVFERGLPAFCEKPLFWEDGSTLADVSGWLDALIAHPGRQLFVNTSNAAFIDVVAERLPPPDQVEDFFFRFHTQGTYRGEGIAVDLLPHAFSLLIRLLGTRKLSGYVFDVTETSYVCRFAYGRCHVELDFAQGQDGPGDLLFCVDDRAFRRVQEGRGATYRVSLEDSAAGEALPVEDPFASYICEFLQYCRDPSRPDRSVEAVENMRLMAQVLLN